MRHEIRYHPRRYHHKRHTEAGLSEIAGQDRERNILGLWRLAVRRRQRDWRNVVVETATFVVSQNEGGIRPGRALHQRIDHLRRSRRAHLNIVVRMFVRHCSSAAPLDKYYLREHLIGVGLAKNIEVVTDGENMTLDGGVGGAVSIGPVGKAGQKDAVVLEVVSPRNIILIQDVKNRLLLVGIRIELWLSGGRIVARINRPKRCSGKEIQPVGNGV